MNLLITKSATQDERVGEEYEVGDERINASDSFQESPNRRHRMSEQARSKASNWKMNDQAFILPDKRGSC